MKTSRWWPVLFLAPALLGIFLFSQVPTVGSFAVSLTKWDLLGAPRFVGVRNYADLLGDPLFYKVMGQTFTFVVFYVVLDLALALALALALNQPLRGLGFFRTAYFLPVVSSMVAVSLLWLWIYDPRYGTLNALLVPLGIGPIYWLSDPHWALFSIIILSVWKYLGYDTILFLAGLQTIPSQYLEAAAVDGANAWHRFRHITLPMLGPTLLMVGMMATIRSFQIFDPVYLMTQGGPERSTTIMSYWLFQNVFYFFKLGKASALSYILFAILLVLTGLQWLARKRWVHQET